LEKIGHWNFPRNKICSLAAISILIAAKVEEAVSPSISRMIDLLSVYEK